jgi:DNA-binding beta-propeller fold protein YncE
MLAPFSVNGAGTLVVDNVNGLYGFQVGSVKTGKVIATVHLTGTKRQVRLHGIAWTPNEKQVWVADSGTGAPYVHVFRMNNTQGTSWTQTHLVTLSNADPHWITFSIDGQYAYVAGQKGRGKPTDIISTSFYKRVGTIPASEDLLEVDVSNGAVMQVGSQFGVGRVP